MLKKTLQIIKNNPVIYLFYVAGILVNLFIILLLYPKDFTQMMDVSDPGTALISYLVSMGKILFASFLLFVIGIFFSSAIGNAVREAVFSGRTTVSALRSGIKIYITRVLLAMLLITAMVIAASIVLSILTIPFTMMAVMNNANSPMIMILIIMIVTVIIFLIPMPFFILWIPSMFLENVGVIHSLKLGVKAGAKNYWRLLIGMIILCIPEVIYMIFNFEKAAVGKVFTLGYFVLLGVMAILSLIFFVYTFEVYHEYRIRQLAKEQPVQNGSLDID